ncbi:DUF2079 domain-containing protein [Microtetraspora malaysiensis]|uniref:DUF2079 domain-containing protein n=1 Tax=Microtetraspora malaysiensis TaxID=161358 RepID=UPI0034E29CD4
MCRSSPRWPDPDFSVLGDHWSPILASLAPFYWLHDGPETLLALQGVLLAAAIPPLWLLSRRRLGGPGQGPWTPR